MHSEKSTVAIILPAYNEEKTICATIEAFHRELPNANIIVVNNNSTDRTAEIAYETIYRLDAKGTVLSEPKQGKGNAVRRAFMDINVDIYVIADADMTYPAEQINELIHPILEGQADMVVGDRHSSGDYNNENKRYLHNFGNNLIRFMVNKLFNSCLIDIMSGYRAFNQKFVKNYPILVQGFQLEADMTLHALDKRFKIMEIPIKYKDRPAGSFSKLNTFSDGARVIFTIFQILRYYRPLMFFGSIATIFMLFGLLASVPVFYDWVTMQYIYHVPLAILASAFEIVAIIMFGVGIMLDSISHQQRMSYEWNLLKITTKI